MRSRAGDWLDDFLRVVAIVVWIVVGAPSWTLLARAPNEIGSGRPWLWCALYVAFATALLFATSPRVALPRRRALLLVQTAFATALAVIGMPHFEGAAFAIVAAQVPSLLRPLHALAWDGAQALVLFPIILPSHGVLGAAKAVGEYFTFALFAFCILYLRAREAAARAQLAESHAALARSHAELLGMQSLLADDARTGERLRVAREVHDAIGHGLTAASLHLQIAARANAGSEPIAAAQAAVRSTLKEVRTVVREMRDDAKVDLGTALRALCTGIREPRVRLMFEEPLRVSDPHRAHVLYRFVQEALTNVVRHARAGECFVEVAVTDDAIVATVRDDGVGVASARVEPATSAASARGSGLDGLRERLEEVGGTLAIESRPGAGFTLRARIPRAEEAA